MTWFDKARKLVRTSQTDRRAPPVDIVRLFTELDDSPGAVEWGDEKTTKFLTWGATTADWLDSKGRIPVTVDKLGRGRSKKG